MKYVYMQVHKSKGKKKHLSHYVKLESFLIFLKALSICFPLWSCHILHDLSAGFPKVHWQNSAYTCVQSQLIGAFPWYSSSGLGITFYGLLTNLA